MGRNSHKASLLFSNTGAINLPQTLKNAPNTKMVKLHEFLYQNWKTDCQEFQKAYRKLSETN